MISPDRLLLRTRFLLLLWILHCGQFLLQDGLIQSVMKFQRMIGAYDRR